MLRFLPIVAVCFHSCVLAGASLVGTIYDASRTPLDGVDVAVFHEDGKGLKTATASGSFVLANLAEGDYFFRALKDGKAPVYGSVHLVGNESRVIEIGMVEAAAGDSSVKASGPLRAGKHGAKTEGPHAIQAAHLIHKVSPVYPVAAREQRLQGSVKIAVIILTDGTLDDLVVTSAPSRDMAISALRAVRRWKYSPTYVDKEPVEVSVTIEVNFSLG